MLRFIQTTFIGLTLVTAAPSASAFSLQGPLEPWMTADLSYDLGGVDIGGPMNLGEEYRWNMPEIFYGFDPSFLDFFGQQGVMAVEAAVKIYNDLPPMSSLSADLSEFPLETRRINHRASELGLIDLKSEALTLMVQELGLAGAERYIWTLRSRITINIGGVDVPFYTVIKRNFDPVTLAPSSYVNEALYTFQAIDHPNFVATWDAAEIAVDPNSPLASSVSIEGDIGNGVMYDASRGRVVPGALGQFFTGLTRDDVGGLRYIYRNANRNVENAPAGAIGSGGTVWGIPGATNNFANTALRPGLEKIAFTRVNFDSLLGTFVSFTNRYSETIITNGVAQTQTLERALAQPDLLFSAGDLGLLGPLGRPVISSRTDAAAWSNNDAINGLSPLNGPGVITASINIAFSKLSPYNLNQGNTREEDSYYVAAWGSFDGSTNAPVVYPIGFSIYELEQIVIGTESQFTGQAWTLPQ